MSKRVVVAALFHETHTFLRGTTGVEAFPPLSPRELLESAGGPTQAAGAMEVAGACGWRVIPGPYWFADPSGIVEDAVLELFWNELSPLLPYADGIYLDLHGAMVARSYPDVEGELLRRIRQVTDIPISVALDLHGNMTLLMEQEGVCVTAYRQNPHTDSKETAIRAARLLDRMLTTGERPRIVQEQPPLVWPPTGTGTAWEPMRLLEAEARRLEQAHPEVWDVSVFGGFAFADIPECGPSFLATTTGAEEVVCAGLRRLSALAVEHREKGCPPSVPLEDALADVCAHPPQPGDGPVVLIEPSDNIGGGAPGDTTWILRGLHEWEIGNSAVALWDPAAVQALWQSPPGAEVTLRLGGHSGEIGSEPLTLTVTKISESDGVYTLEDPQSHNSMYGLTQTMGRSVVVRTDAGVTVLLTSNRTAPMDLGQWTSQGIDPRTLSVVSAKAAVAHRQAYDPIASRSIVVSTPGPCDENLRRLPFQNVRRPVWPLD